MRYKTVKKAIHHVLKNNPSQPTFLVGEPGTAKTSLCFDIAKDLGIPKDRILLFRPSLRESVDLN